MQIPLLDLKAQYATIRDEIRTSVDEVLESQHFILGPTVEKFENEIAQYCNTEYAIGVASGTDALVLSLMAIVVINHSSILSSISSISFSSFGFGSQLT